MELFILNQKKKVRILSALALRLYVKDFELQVSSLLFDCCSCSVVTSYMQTIRSSLCLTFFNKLSPFINFFQAAEAHIGYAVISDV